MMGFLDTLIIAFMTGGVSSIGTIAALKTDINCKGRLPSGQLKKGYTLKNGRRTPRENATRNADKTDQSKGPLCYRSGSFCISMKRVYLLSIHFYI
ncbi:hypothetical protein A143_09300 [Vibrio splendidus ZS-139]|nr:hypothetical protein A143_09300 [Vibrio splendidus ZS-139]